MAGTRGDDVGPLFSLERDTVLMFPYTEGATTAEKLRGGGKVWVPIPGRLRPVPDQRRGWVLGAGRGRLLVL